MVKPTPNSGKPDDLMHPDIFTAKWSSDCPRHHFMEVHASTTSDGVQVIQIRQPVLGMHKLSRKDVEILVKELQEWLKEATA
jgi:uncharacterized Fe-S cluster-containing protein